MYALHQQGQETAFIGTQHRYPEVQVKWFQFSVRSNLVFVGFISLGEGVLLVRSNCHWQTPCGVSLSDRARLCGLFDKG